MDSPPKPSTWVHELDQALTPVIAVDPASLVRTQELGALNFEAQLPLFTGMIEHFQLLARCDMRSAPTDRVRHMVKVAGRVQAQFEAVRAFKIEVANPQQQHDEIVNQFQSINNDVFNQVVPVLAYMMLRDLAQQSSAQAQQIHEAVGRADGRIQDAVTAMQSELAKTSEQATQVVQDRVTELNALTLQATQTLDSARKLSASTAVSAYATFFKTRADEHSSAAAPWLWATVGMAATTLLFVLGAIVWHALNPPTTEHPFDPSLAVSQVSALSILFFSVVFCGRLYRAHRHNATLNLHRMTALETFEAFAKASTDDQTRNAVLLQATTAIFSPQLTGYLGQEGEPASPVSILELIRSPGGKKGD